MNKEVSEKSINAIFGWIGGKKLLREKISAFIPEQDQPVSKRKIQYYVEVFGGVAWMLLYKEKWFKNEVYNDFNNELVNLFNVIKFHPKEFIRQFENLLQSQFMFDFFLNNEVLTDIQRAIKTFYKYHYSYSSNGENFAYHSYSRGNLISKIKEMSSRFDKVSISNKSYDVLIPRFNKNNVFLYLDPPYYDKEYLYEILFSKEDHNKLCELLKKFKGKFALSYNKHPEIKSLYKDFRIEVLKTEYLAFRKEKEVKEEYLIMNY